MSLIRRATTAPIQIAAAAVLIAVAMIAGGCNRDQPPAAKPTGASAPAQAVSQLIEDLQANDLVAYTRHALPPALHDQMVVAWSEGHTIWPLTELPLDDRLPGFITVLAAAGAEKSLLSSYQRQFAGADRELHTAVATLSLFAAQYVQGSSDYSEPERDHYVQLIAALGDWGKQAPLGSTAHAKAAVPQLVAAARLTGLAGPDALQSTGMVRSLTRLGPFFARFKLVLADYGLDIDAALVGAQTRLIDQTGDRARVALEYTLAGHKIDAQILMERHQGRWYLTDLLRHAQAQVDGHGLDTSPDPTPASKAD
ncbi:MAG: hypothetical protein ACOH1P_06235 [Lysobacter sp.]